MDNREDYEAALINWAQRYNGYERIAEDHEHANPIFEPLQEKLLESGEIPRWIGVDLLRGWAFFIARGHRWSGHNSIFVDCPEFELIAEAVRHHPAATPTDMPPSAG